ncbi:putative Transcription factor domain-containing protein [Seiridium cardinale]|uniref:Transcription factor domain-containing protein n=1 Tax=Seiridium cardinale TaxID=138064 RepID=A0ABR2YAC8_9PEZI
MAASGSAFSETLQEITNTKLEELSKRRHAYGAEKAAALASIQGITDPIERLHALANCVRKCLRITVDGAGKVVKGWSKFPALEIELKNLDRFLAQVRYDPSISLKTVEQWESSLLQHLERQSLKFSYASLYGQLVTEWLSSEGTKSGSTDEDVDMNEDFEQIDNAKKLQARMEWEKVVFEPAKVDLDKLMRYLDNLFGVGNPQKKPLFRVLVRLREEVKEFERSFSNVKQFTPHSLRWVIQGLVRSDLLTDEKREVLKDFANNDIILDEIADVLNMRMATLGTWSWGDSVPLEQRRAITGAFRIHMHEDILQSLFLHYIGVKLSMFFKQAFRRFRKSPDAWIPNHQEIPVAVKNRLEYYLGPLDRPDSLQNLRYREYRKNYFMSQLVRSENQLAEATEGDEEADYTHASGKKGMTRGAGQNAAQQQSIQHSMPQQQWQGASNHALQDNQLQLMLLEQQNKKRMMMPRSENPTAKRMRWTRQHGDDGSETEDEDHMHARSPMAKKKKILHLLSTEIAINTELHGEMTAFHSVFDGWYSLFPHDTVETIMALFGFSTTWRTFFRAYLEAPLKFLDDDDSTQVRIRRRGTPGAHALSEVFGEVALFVLDFSVNQSTSGNFLWRHHDDIWFWSPDQQVCVQAWKAVTEFTEVTGTKINFAKTGSSRLTKDATTVPSVDPSLPQGDIRWGFLYLSPEKGHFVIDQDMVDTHIAELRKQLKEQNKSVFGFIQTWNAFAATFFTSNFGKPVNCFGKAHVDEMLKTHERIQREIFSADSLLGVAGQKSSNIVEYLKNTIEERFGVADIPDGYLYFPVELGGLDLQSPFISLLQIRDALIDSPKPFLQQLHESETEGYKKAKKAFENGSVRHLRADVDDPNWEPAFQKDRETFISFEDFVKYREEWCFGYNNQVHNVYQRLLEEPAQESIDSDGAMLSKAVAPLASQPSLRCIHGNWHSMEPYWKWVTMLYGPEIHDRFGGLNIVDSDVLPMGMVRLFKEKRVKWQT